MGQVRHGSATTTHAVSAGIQRSQASLAELSREQGINPKRVARWRTRATVSKLEDALLSLLKECPKRARALAILCPIPGLGRVTAVAILFEYPEIGPMARKQIARLAGLAPMTRRSRQWLGKAFIKGGRKCLRDALYMPALVAARYNPDLKQKYRP